MDNVTTFKTILDTPTSLVVVDQMSPREALSMHTKVKGQGRGAVKAFVKNDTAYDSYPKYYYALKKIGVVPFNPRGPKVTSSPSKTDLEFRIQQLELQIAVSSITPAKRAVELLCSSMDNISYTSRKFLCSVVQRNSATVSPKQEAWLSGLEQQSS
jgi:hypothetical protein